MDLTKLLETLRFDFNALAEAEAKTGQNLLSAIAAWPELSALQARGLLFALLLPAHPKVTVAEAGSLFTEDMEAVVRGIRVALIAAQLFEDEAPVAGEEPARVESV
jgi:hypothetical protein